MSNRSWSVKNTYFQILAADEDIADKLLKAAEANGVSLSRPSKLILEQAKYVPYVKSLAAVQDWTAELVKSRSTHMAERAWVQFERWLKLDPT